MGNKTSKNKQPQKSKHKTTLVGQDQLRTENEMKRVGNFSSSSQKFSVKGHCLMVEGSVPGNYTGDLNAHSRPHGRGVADYIDGSSYNGQWKDGKKHGEGVFTDITGYQTAERWDRGERVFSHPIPRPRTLRSFKGQKTFS